MLIANGLSEAWEEGRVFSGKLGGSTFMERSTLLREISKEISYVYGFTRAIDALVRDGKDASLITRRIELWGDAYTRVYNVSSVYNGADRYYRWDLHPAEHCATCRSLSGQIRSAREWLAAGYYPKSWSLDCHQGCKCSFSIVSASEVL